ncbi:TolC family protein [Prolixibacteraceae bacterium JC049]|nr:TolC family protein [Prolixibacteraceae bacterium JC049]
MRKKIFSIAIVFLCGSAFAQEKLTLQKAIDITLQNNYDIQIARLENKVAKNNAEAGNAGLLPTVYAEGGYDYSSNNTEIELLPFNQGENVGSTKSDVDNAVTETTRGAIKVEYTLFDGFGGSYRLKQLNAINGLTMLETQNSIENTVLSTIRGYLNVAIQQAGIEIYEDQLNISKERLKRSENDFSYGVTNRTSVLRALVHVKNDSVALRKTKLKYRTAKTALNALLGRDLSTDFEVEEQVQFLNMMSKAKLEKAVEQNNTLLKMAEQGLSVSFNNLQVIKSQRLPKLFVNGGYNYLDQENEAGLLKEQNQKGWNLGVGVRFNIFDGNRVKRGMQNAKIEIQQNELRVQDSKQQVLALFNNTYDEYVQAKKDLRIDNTNLETFEQSFTRCLIDYQNGQISSTDLREAQLDLSTAKLRIVYSSFTVKQKEAELLKLSGLMLHK